MEGEWKVLDFEHLTDVAEQVLAGEPLDELHLNWAEVAFVRGYVRSRLGEPMWLEER